MGIWELYPQHAVTDTQFRLANLYSGCHGARMSQISLGNRPQLLFPARFTYVDLLRGLSAVAVLFFHFRMFYPDGNSLGPQTFAPDHQPLFTLLWPLYFNGNLAVQFFWALSGFVFMTTYSGQERKVSGGRFFVWRFSRLYPLHFVTLIYLAFLQWISLRTTGSFSVVPINDAYHFFLQLPLASSWGFEAGGSFNTPIWSVSVEVLIYLVFYAYVRAGRTGPIASVVMVGLFFAISRVVHSPIFTCGELFFIGCLLFRVIERLVRFPARTSGLIAFIALGLTIAAAAFLSARGHSPIPIIMFATLPATLLATAVIDLYRSPMSDRWHWVGDITYSTYLVHLPLIVTTVLIGRWIGVPYGWPDHPVVLPVYLIAVIMLGMVVHKRFELPAQDAIRRLYRQRLNYQSGMTPQSSDCPPLLQTQDAGSVSRR